MSFGLLLMVNFRGLSTADVTYVEYMTFVVCLVIDCGPPDVPVSGSVGSGNTTCGQSLSFACDECYNLTKGSHNRKCLPTGNWSGSVPTCECQYRLSVFNSVE